MSPSPSAYKNSLDSPRSSADTSRQNTTPRKREPTPKSPLPLSSAAIVASGQDHNNPLWIQGEQSNAYWNKITHDALAAQNRQSRLLAPDRPSVPGADRKLSIGSEFLSSDYASSNGENDDEDGDVLKCDNCQGTNFRASRGRNGKQRLVCVGCLRPMS